MVWYEAEVQQLEATLKTLPAATNRVVFYGSSSIRLWTTLAKDFPQINVVNAGFGGSTLAACSWFFDRLVVPVKPSSLVFYAGDNDLGDGRHPEEVYLFFCTFAEKMRRSFPDVPVSFLSIKISPARWHMVNQIRYANQLIADEIDKQAGYQFIDMATPLLSRDGQPCRSFFEDDGLHLSQAGYRVWQEVIQQQAGIF